MSKCSKQFHRFHRALFKWAVSLIVWAVWRTEQSHATDLTGGNLTLTGNADIGGDNLQLGTPSGITNAGLTLSYLDGSPTSVPDQIQFISARSTSSWLWLYTTTGNTAVPQMWLDDTNTLTLYDRSTTPAPGIQLNPTGTSLFVNSLTVNGTDNRMPNQTLADPSSVLTEQLADGRYLSLGAATSTYLTQSAANAAYVQNGGSGITVGTASGYMWGQSVSGPALALPGGSATGAYSFAGISATASGPFSMATGYGSTASGYHSTASGNNSSASGIYSAASALNATASGEGAIASGVDSIASGSNSVASGFISTASGFGSTASGYRSTANGNFSIATGHYSTASGNYSTASGWYATASGYSQFVVGQFNWSQGNPTAWVATDDLFQIGNGISPWMGSGGNSNAFAVKKNGTTSVFGNQLNFGLITGQTPGTDASTATHIAYADGTAGAVTFSAARPNTTWAWQNNDTATAKPQMKLDGNNILTIYDASGNPAIVLDPSHPSNSTTVLTEGVANGLYVPATELSVVSEPSQGLGSGVSVSIGSGTANAPYAFASGYESHATATSATAMGVVSTASGVNSVAIGVGSNASGVNSTASGYSSNASGFCSVASGPWSTASATYAVALGIGASSTGNVSLSIGRSSSASGNYSTTLGYWSNASGQYATSAGEFTTAASYGQFVVGQYNAQQGDPNNWNATDDLFQIGNGTDAAHPSNALTVKKNGDTTINGAATIAGNAVIQGQLTVTHVVPQGDISMGTFTAGQ